MSSEAQARVNVSLRDIVSFMEAAGVRQHSIALLNEFINKHQVQEFLTLAANFGKCNAFVDHDQLHNMLYTSWSLLFDGYTIEKKTTLKKIKILKEDKKSDPDVLARQENTLNDIEQKKANVLVNVIKFKAMITIPIADFKDDPNFDFKSRHAANVERRKLLQSQQPTKK